MSVSQSVQSTQLVTPFAFGTPVPVSTPFTFGIPIPVSTSQCGINTSVHFETPTFGEMSFQLQTFLNNLNIPDNASFMTKRRKFISSERQNFTEFLKTQVVSIINNILDKLESKTYSRTFIVDLSGDKVSAPFVYKFRTSDDGMEFEVEFRQCITELTKRYQLKNHSVNVKFTDTVSQRFTFTITIKI